MGVDGARLLTEHACVCEANELSKARHACAEVRCLPTPMNTSRESDEKM